MSWLDDMPAEYPSEARWVIQICRSCGAFGLDHRPMAHNDCEAVQKWHQWFEDHPNVLTRGENPITVPTFRVEVMPVPGQEVVKPNAQGNVATRR